MTTARQIDVFLLPTLAESEQLAGKLVVVIDVLRATTTIIHALVAGATHIVPCLKVDEARQLADQAGDSAVLGGERRGLALPDFDLGNSPAEYTPARVGGKAVIFTTTNGTRAMLRCKVARRVLIGAFVNLTALCRELSDQPQIALVCAGTNGQITREDTLLAGAIVHELHAGGTHNDQAEIAADAWRACVRDLTGNNPLGRALRASRGGRNLIDTGQENDIDIAGQIDKFDLVPELDLATWTIRLP